MQTEDSPLTRLIHILITAQIALTMGLLSVPRCASVDALNNWLAEDHMPCHEESSEIDPSLDAFTPSSCACLIFDMSFAYLPEIPNVDFSFVSESRLVEQGAAILVSEQELALSLLLPPPIV